jgi:hypothetical protein
MFSTVSVSAYATTGVFYQMNVALLAMADMVVFGADLDQPIES